MMKRVLAAILAVGILFSGLQAPRVQVVEASALSEAQAKKKKLEQQLQEAQNKLAAYKKQLSNADSETEKLEAELAVQAAEKETLTAELLTLYSHTEQIVAAMQDAQAAYEKAAENFKEKSRIMYVYSTQSPLEILAASEGFSDFFKRIQLILYLSRQDNALLEELKNAKQDYEYKKQYQEECQELVSEMIAQKDLSIDNITLTKEELQEKIAKAKKLLSEEEQKQASLKEDLKAVQNEIKVLQNTRPAGGSGNTGSGNTGSGNTGNGNSGPYTGGKLLWPVPVYKRISSNYGPRKDPFTGKTATHTGIDISAAKGSSILAAQSGTVILAGNNGSYGLCVKIDHGGGLVTLYGHCNELLVKPGQKVKKGDLIARVGTTGRSTGYHLHFEVRLNNKHTNPMPYLKG